MVVGSRSARGRDDIDNAQRATLGFLHLPLPGSVAFAGLAHKNGRDQVSKGKCLSWTDVVFQ